MKREKKSKSKITKILNRQRPEGREKLLIATTKDICDSRETSPESRRQSWIAEPHPFPSITKNTQRLHQLMSTTKDAESRRSRTGISDSSVLKCKQCKTKSK